MQSKIPVQLYCGPPYQQLCIHRVSHRVKDHESEVAQSCPTLCDPWTVVGQAPPSTGFSRQEYWSGLPFPSPGDLPDSGIRPGSPALQADSSLSEPPGDNLCIRGPV